MTSKGLTLVAIALFGLLSLQTKFAWAAEEAGPPQSTSGVQKTIEDRMAAIEAYIEQIVRTLSGQSRATEVPVPKTMTREVAQLRTADAAELTKKRLEAAERSLSNVASFLATKSAQAGSKCRWVRECVYVSCCRWGAPPSDPGTVKCMEQCCGAWENRLVCD